MNRGKQVGLLLVLSLVALTPLLAAFIVRGPVPSTQEEDTGITGCSTAPNWARTAEALVKVGETERAEEIYQAVLAEEPTNDCAVRGLAALSLAPSPPATSAEKLGQAWSDVLAKNLAPLAPAVAAVFALLLFLLVIARLCTPLIGPDRVSPERFWLRAIWWTGLVLLLEAAVVPVLTTTLSSVGVVAPLSKQPAAWVGGAVAAILGIPLVAASRGLALRLVAEVRGTSGTADSNLTQYFVGRMGALGTQPPKGLEVPEQTDVTALPADALTTLPDSALAKALFRVLQAVRPATPWRVAVGIQNLSTVTVSMSRNGRSTGPPRTFTRAELELPALTPDATDGVASADSALNDLITTASAHVLLELSRRHRELQVGLCGASRSRSLAMHSIATGDPLTIDAKLRRRLLAAAVADDPGNALARVANLDRLGARAEADDQRAAARAARRELSRLSDTLGFFPLRLRLNFVIVATELNALLIDRKCRTQRDVITAVIDLIDAIREPQAHASNLDELITEMRHAAYFLVLGVKSSTDKTQRDAEPRWRAAYELAQCWEVGDDVPLTAPSAYDRACWRVEGKAPAGDISWAEAALLDLEVAVTRPALRQWAILDPSLSNLRDNAQYVKQFKELTGDEIIDDFLDSDPFRYHKDALNKMGVHTPIDLLALDADVVKAQFGVSPRILRGWKQIAHLGTAYHGNPPLTPVLMDIVVQMGVRSRRQLRRRVRQDPEAWAADVATKCRSLNYVPPDTEQWRELVKRPWTL